MPIQFEKKIKIPDRKLSNIFYHISKKIVRYITKKIVRSSPAGGGVLRLCSYLNFMLFTFNKQDIGLIFCCENRSSYEVDSWMRNR
ncbi:uncharacterized protein OCT59_006234 [Rhizophagus irregularis]|uniref:uncharacterized protein n=1 Tax=Rhizophagus irregularis TaxID=588596 RepID=UPI001A06777C|nr:hypothetical protein OCT59_006234 [Rhizophagus irregularis]GET64214.1 hypothetical protein RIR_jg4914.t1 [Rhizophagus irregularis DAOM 181602=DAOM 197198]